MDNFVLETSGSETQDLPTMITNACKEMEENLKPLLVRLSGYFDYPDNTLVIEGKAFDNNEIHHKYLNIFFDIFYYLPMDITGKRYRFVMNTYSDISLRKEVHSFVMETSLDAMPGTAEITRADWKQFVSQLLHTRDGVKAILPEPAPFIDDELPERKEK